MIKINTMLLLSLFLHLRIDDSVRAAPLPRADTMIYFNEGSQTTKAKVLGNSTDIDILVPQCPQTLTYEEILQLLKHHSCASSTKNIGDSLISHRKRRAESTGDDQTVASTNHIYALQSTINDHRTMIDDHRKMIYYLMNNTVNVTHLSQHYSTEHVRTAPIWRSWRDVSLLLLLSLGSVILIGLLVNRLRLLDLLTTFLVRRQHHQKRPESKSHPPKQHAKVLTSRQPQSPSEVPAPFAAAMPISNITHDYIRHQYNSNESL